MQNMSFGIDNFNYGPVFSKKKKIEDLGENKIFFSQSKGLYLYMK
jgi:hypothetical protein